LELIKNWAVKSNTSDYNLDRIKYEIDLGNNDTGGINLKPFYQRDYKFTKKDESLLIESLLGGIPIPVIYLASDTSKIPHISNVIDGRADLYFLAVGSISVDKGDKARHPIFKNYFLKKLMEGKSKTQALICIMRQLICILYSMMKNKTEWKAPEYKRQISSEVLKQL
jgi:hypothetical protein